jgi:hypothetical protein
MTDLFHTEDNGVVVIDLVNKVTFYALPLVTYEGVKLGFTNIKFTDDKETFYLCNECNQIVKIADIGTFCIKCGKLLPSTRLYKIIKPNGQTLSGFWCSECLIDQRYSSKLLLADLLEKLELNR